MERSKKDTSSMPLKRLRKSKLNQTLILQKEITLKILNLQMPQLDSLIDPSHPQLLLYSMMWITSSKLRTILLSNNQPLSS